MKKNEFFRAPELKERKIRGGRKWTPASHPIEHMNELKALLDARWYIFHRTKGYHHGWVRSWQFGYIDRLITSGQLFAGVRSRHVPYTWRASWVPSPEPHIESWFWVSCDEIHGIEVVSKDHGYVIRPLELTRKATGNADARVHVVFRGEDQL